MAVLIADRRQMYHIETEEYDRGKKKTDRSVERMTLRAGDAWIRETNSDG